MTKGSVRAAKVLDAVYLAPLLRHADRQECIAALGQTPEEVLPGSVSTATAAFTMLDHHRAPMGMFGVHAVPGMPLVGAVWMVATPTLIAYATQFLRESRAAVNRLHKFYPALVNLVDARNTVHIRWIEWAGFTLLATRPCYGPGKLPFIEFAKVQS